jgi:hypothetical protein
MREGACAILFTSPCLRVRVWAVPMSDQLRDALTLAQEKRDHADVEHRLAALLPGPSVTCV